MANKRNNFTQQYDLIVGEKKNIYRIYNIYTWIVCIMYDISFQVFDIGI